MTMIANSCSFHEFGRLLRHKHLSPKIKQQNNSYSEAGLLNKRLMLSSSIRYDQIYKYEIYDSGHTLLCYLSQTLMFNELASEAGLLNKRLMLSSSFMGDQIYKYNIYDFGRTLLCYLSQTLMFNKPTSEAGLLNKCSCLAPALLVIKFIIVKNMIWGTLCCAT